MKLIRSITLSVVFFMMFLIDYSASAQTEQPISRQQLQDDLTAATAMIREGDLEALDALLYPELVFDEASQYDLLTGVARDGTPEMIALLVERGVDINFVLGRDDLSSQPALHHALFWGNEDVAVAFLNLGASTTFDPGPEGGSTFVSILLGSSAGLEPSSPLFDLRTELEGRFNEESREAAFFSAVAEGNTYLMNTLMSLSYSPSDLTNAINGEGLSPLMVAAASGVNSVDVYRLLIQFGRANVETATTDGSTALDFAILNVADRGVLRWLIGNTEVYRRGPHYWELADVTGNQVALELLPVRPWIPPSFSDVEFPSIEVRIRRYMGANNAQSQLRELGLLSWDDSDGQWNEATYEGLASYFGTLFSETRRFSQEFCSVLFDDLSETFPQAGLSGGTIDATAAESLEDQFAVDDGWRWFFRTENGESAAIGATNGENGFHCQYERASLNDPMDLVFAGISSGPYDIAMHFRYSCTQGSGIAVTELEHRNEWVAADLACSRELAGIPIRDGRAQLWSNY